MIIIIHFCSSFFLSNWIADLMGHTICKARANQRKFASSVGAFERSNGSANPIIIPLFIPHYCLCLHTPEFFARSLRMP